MHDLRTIFRNSVLFCAIIADFCVISLSFALDTTYEVGGVTRTSEFIPNPAGANGSKAVYTPNSATKMPNGTRIPYGLRGTLRTSSKLFKQLLIAEAGLEVLDWVSSQYQKPNETAIIDENLNWNYEQEITNYLCGSSCYFSNASYGKCGMPAGNAFSTLFEALYSIQQCAANFKYNVEQPWIIATRQELSIYPSFQQTGLAATLQVTYKSELNPNWITTGVFEVGYSGTSVQSIGKQKFNRIVPAGEPTIEPNPLETGQIIEAYVGKIGGWGDFVSPNVQILDQQIRWTELPSPAGMPTVDTVTDLIRVPGYDPKPPAIIPDPEPLRPDPEGLKKIQNPLLQGLPDPTTPYPPPAVRTQDLIGGGMTVTNTYNITNNNTSTRVELNLENKEITYTQDDSEIEVPEDLSVEEIESNLPRLKIPMLEPERLVDAAFNAAGGFVVHDLLDDKTNSCPPPRTLSIIGGKTVQMPFDPLCDFLAMIKKVFVPVVGWIIFLMWIRRIGSS